MSTIDHQQHGDHHDDSASSDGRGGGGGLTVHVRSATKDSLAVVWRSAADLDHHESSSSAVISGYKVRYQAVGSTVVQYSHLLQVRRRLCECKFLCFTLPFVPRKKPCVPKNFTKSSKILVHIFGCF